MNHPILLTRGPRRTLALLFFLAVTQALLANLGGENSENRFLSQARQLTYEGKRSGEGYFSEDGKKLVFQSEREAGNPFYQIYLLDLDSGETHRLSTGVGKTTCSFFRPGSDEVLFASTHGDPESLAQQKKELDFRASGKQRRYSWDYDEAFDIYAVRRDGTKLRRLTKALGYDAEASYSPDGKKIVFTSLRDAYPSKKLSPEDRRRFETDPSYFGEIYIMNANGSDQRRLTRTPGYDGGPFFSPDGQRIIFRRFDEKGLIADVYTMKLDGSDQRRLTDFGCMSWAPYFHPSGQYLIFTANKLGFENFELFIVDAAGEREPVRVTYTDGFDGLPVFSPDGKRLCWTSNRTADNKSQLFLADWSHEAASEALKAAPLRTRSVSIRNEHAAVAVSSDQAGISSSTSFSAQITAEDCRSYVSYLASDALEGRLTGTPGSALAADYIADQLRRAGAKPFGEFTTDLEARGGGTTDLRPLGKQKTFFQPFDFTAGVSVVTNENKLIILSGTGETNATSFQVENDFRPLSFTANSEIEGEVVFAGYGLSAPGKPGEGYDSYAGLNVTNKIVLVLRYVPENVDPKRRQELNRYAALRYKAMIARERGAKGILIVTGPNSPNAGALAPISADGSLQGSGIVAASIGTNAAQAMFSAAGKDLSELQSALDSENPHAEGGFGIPKLTLKIATRVERIRKSDRNVLAFLPPLRDPSLAEYVLVGAHYDHLGYGEASSSRMTKEEAGQIHNGADDNASGVAAVLEIASALAEEQKRSPESFRRGVIFAFWSGEELGLLGSSHFAEKPTLSLSNVVAYVNFDMVGRLRDNKLTLQGIGSSAIWRRLIEKRNVAAGFNLVLQEDPYLPTDVTALYPKQIPVISFFTGSHENYHRPTDDTETLNYEGMEKIAQFARGLVLDLIKEPARPDYVKVTGGSSGGSRDNLRVYLGTVPDYTSEVSGVKLSGVRAGSPADKAGLKGGDVIVEFAGLKIANIYDYTYALDAAKIGQEVEMSVLREDKKVTLKVTPEARK